MTAPLKPRSSPEPLVEVHDLVKYFRLPGTWPGEEARYVHAVDRVNFEIARGEVFGLVGESGCGKTTLGRLLLRLTEPTAGWVTFDGRDLMTLNTKALRQLRPQMQIVFQNPLSSLSPRLKILDIVAEPLRTHQLAQGPALRARVLELLNYVGLSAQYLDRFPHEMSGGQCQRVAIARALALHPHLIVLDEPTSALDVSVQAQILNLLEDLRRADNLTYVFISHDLNVVQHISHRIGVMYLGQLVEVGSSRAIFEAPLHPYTQALLGSIPVPDVGQQRERVVLKGNVPSPANPPTGCRFHPRCPIAKNYCKQYEPQLREVQPGRRVACHLVEPVWTPPTVAD